MKALPSSTLAATVRAYFGLSQAELAILLGVTGGQVAHVEAGRHQFSAPVTQRLAALAQLMELPVAATAAPANLPLAAASGAVDVQQLQARLRVCQLKVARLQQQWQRQQTKMQQAQRWLAATAHLLTATAADKQPVDSTLQPWLESQAALAAAELSAPLSTARALLALRLRLLEAEVAEIQQWLFRNDGNFTP